MCIFVENQHKECVFFAPDRYNEWYIKSGGRDELSGELSSYTHLSVLSRWCYDLLCESQ